MFQFLSLIHPHILRLLKEETVFAQKGTVMFNLFIANVSEQKLINYLGVFSFSFFFSADALAQFVGIHSTPL